MSDVDDLMPTGWLTDAWLRCMRHHAELCSRYLFDSTRPGLDLHYAHRLELDAHREAELAARARARYEALWEPWHRALELEDQESANA